MNKITNLKELQEEIVRLEQKRLEQQAYLEGQVQVLKYKVNKPVRFIQNMFSFIPNGAALFGSEAAKGKPGFHEDWLTKGLRIGLPFLVNKAFFPKAGYLKRLAVGLLSNQAAGFLNKDRLARGIEAITSWIKKPSSSKAKTKKKEPYGDRKSNYDFGIPPDSETY